MNIAANTHDYILIVPECNEDRVELEKLWFNNTNSKISYNDDHEINGLYIYKYHEM